ncbi:MAG: hypothetical protein P8Z76_21060 [Alphaproteobacteria bacterium]
MSDYKSNSANRVRQAAEQGQDLPFMIWHRIHFMGKEQRHAEIENKVLQLLVTISGQRQSARTTVKGQ